MTRQISLYDQRYGKTNALNRTRPSKRAHNRLGQCKVYDFICIFPEMAQNPTICLSPFQSQWSDQCENSAKQDSMKGYMVPKENFFQKSLKCTHSLDYRALCRATTEQTSSSAELQDAKEHAKPPHTQVRFTF